MVESLDLIFSSYLGFYNEVCPYQGLENRPLTGKWPEINDPLTAGEKIVCMKSSADCCDTTNVLLLE